MAREEFPDEDSQQKNEKKFDKQTGEEELPALIKSKDDEIIEQTQTILKSLSLASTREELEKADELLKTLIKFVDQNPLNYELYYLLIEGFNTVLNGQFKNGRADFIVELIEKLITYMYHNLNIDECLVPTCDSILLAIEILLYNDFYIEFEKYSTNIINQSFENPANIVLRTTAAEITILAIKAYGREWNYDKVDEYSEFLNKLLPIDEVNGFLAGVLIKGLAQEIDCYGDMHEITEMKNAIKKMKDVYTKNKDNIEELIINYSNGLVHAIKWFGEDEDFDFMMENLEELREIASTFNDNFDVKIAYGYGLRIALDLSGIMADLDNTTRLAKELFDLASDIPDNRNIQQIAIVGIFKAATWAGAYWETGLILSLLSNLSDIYQRFSDDYEIKIMFGRGLFNLTRELSETSKRKVIEQIIFELQLLYTENPHNLALARYYAKSLVNTTYMLAETSEKPDEIYPYIKESEALVNEYPDDEEILLSYTKVLVNTVRMLGMFGNLEEMEEIIDIIKDYSISTENREIAIRLHKAYIDAIKAYGDMNILEKIKVILGDIRDYLEEDPTDIAFQTLYSKALVNTISCYGKNKLHVEMNVYLDELREMAVTYDVVNDIQVQFVKGLTLAIRYLVQNGDPELLETLLEEIRTKSLEFPEVVELLELFARSLRRIINYNYRINNQTKVNELLEDLRQLVRDNSKIENIQLELARVISNIIIDNPNQKDDPYWQAMVMEFKGLTIQFPDNERIELIHQMIFPMIMD
ncbi:MAG: hypothetical protein ACTSVP_06950 [Candidatus Heimdallarchaeota archaeon]